MKFITAIVVGLALLIVGGYLLLWGSSTVYISGGIFRNAPVPSWHIHEMLAYMNVPGLPAFNVIRVEKVDITHLPRNILFLYCTVALAVVSLFGIVIGCVGIVIYGIARGDWSLIGGGVGFIIISPIIGIGIAILPIGIIIGLLFQTCTPIYALSFIILALPTLAAGLVTGAAPAAPVYIVIVK